MTTDYSYSLSSLAQILSALEGERRNPNTKRNAIKAIERAAAGSASTATTSSMPPTGCSAAG